MMNYLMQEDNNNLKRNKDYKNKPSWKEMNFRRLFKLKNKKEKSKLNLNKKRKNQSRNTLNNLENKSLKMKKRLNKSKEIDQKKEKRLKTL